VGKPQRIESRDQTMVAFGELSAAGYIEPRIRQHMTLRGEL
jgi:hypothetical protein